MKIDLKQLLLIVFLIAFTAGTYFVYKHFTNQTKVIPTEKDYARDSLDYYLNKQAKALKEFKISGDSATYYANRIDTLNKTLAADSFGADVLRSVQRARIKSDILRAEVRDSLGGQHP